MPDEIHEIDCTVVIVQFSEGVAVGPRLTVIGRRTLGVTTEFRDSFVALKICGHEATNWRDRIQPGDCVSAMCRPTRAILDYQGMRIPVSQVSDHLEILYRPTNPKPAQPRSAVESKLHEVVREKGVAAQLRELGLLHTKPVEPVNL
jgi:hypothetical protein